MFSDSEFNITGFESIPETERLVCDGISQTKPTETSSKETQTGQTQSTAAQTFHNREGSYSVPYDVDELLKFLNRVVPHLEEELKDFDNSSQLSYQNEDRIEDREEFEQTQFRHTLVEPEYCKGKVISNLSWNSTGMLLAVAYCEKNHEGWCNHDTSVGIYNTGKNKFEKNQPEHLLRAPGCVRCVKFHPYVPSVLAVGCHSGEVVVWSLTNDEALTMTKGSDEEAAHVNAITSLVWRQDRRGEWLVTTGRDGRIIFWKVTLTNLTFEVSERFLILKNQLSSTEFQEVVHIGFWPHKESDFLIAAGNSILHCTLKTAKFLPSGSKYRNPVSFYYSAHEGMVTSVSCLPATEIFASCGLDSRINIHKNETITPLYVIYTNKPLMGVRWLSSIKYLISWGCHSKAEYHKISLDEGLHISKNFYQIEGKISTIEINSSRQGKFGIGTTTGEVVVLCDVSF